MIRQFEHLTKSSIKIFKVEDLPAAIRVIRSDMKKNKWILDLNFILYVILSI